MRNLKKKIEYLKEQVHEDEEHSQTSEEEDEPVEDIQPKKKNIKQQRAAVSAEVYGKWNKKEDFVPKVIPKSAEIVEKL